VARGGAGSASDVTNTDGNTPGRIELSSLICAPASPVVFASPPTASDSTEAVVRVESFGTSGFKLWLVESRACDMVHSKETVSWIVTEPGSGPNFEVGTVSLTRLFKPVATTSTGLGKRPWVFTLVQSSNNNAGPHGFTLGYLGGGGVRGYVKTRMTMQSTGAGFNLKLEADATNENSDTSLDAETVAYLAINSGCSRSQSGDTDSFSSFCSTTFGSITIAGTTYKYALGIRSTKTYASSYSVSFGKVFKSTPIVLANVQTYLDADPCEIRTTGISTRKFSFSVEHDKSVLFAPYHGPEWVAWLALGNY